MLTFAHLPLLVVFIGFCLVQGAPIHTNDLDVRHLEDTIYERDIELTIAKRGGPSRWLPAFRKLKATSQNAEGPHVFWSGQTQGQSVKADAERHAKKVGGTTIGQNLRTSGVRPPPGGQNAPGVKKWWDLASKVKAKFGKGEAHAVLGSKVNKDSVWNRIERPELMKNPHVSSVSQVHPKTGKPIKQLKP